MESKKDPEAEEWELCESESSQQFNSGKNIKMHDRIIDETIIKELREEIASLKQIVAAMHSDLKSYVQPLYSDIPSPSASIQKQQPSTHQSSTASIVEEEGALVGAKISIGIDGKPSNCSIWAVTNLGEIFVNEKHTSCGLNQLKNNTHMQEMDFTGTSTPVSIPLDMGCIPGTEIIITGYIEEDAKRMHINLDSQPTVTDSSKKRLVESRNVNFHFNPRFDNDPYEQGVVVRNTMTGGSWGSEERQGDMPFKLGDEFTLKIVCCADCYVVYVDDQLYCKYKHRLSPYTVTGVSIWQDVVPYKVMIKNVPSELNPNNMIWQQLGGHFKSIETCTTGLTWGIGYDHTAWVYNGGWGGSFFGNLDYYNVKSMTDYEDHYIYENQRWNRVTKSYTPDGLTTDVEAWNNKTNKEKTAQDLLKLLSVDNWLWISNWKIDFQEPGIDSEGWQYVTNKPTRLGSKKYENYSRRRRWQRRCAINTTGPWMQLKDKKLLDVSFAPLDDDTVDSVVTVWAVTSDGQIVMWGDASQANPKGIICESVSSDQDFVSISCGPFDHVWGIGKDGNAYTRIGINKEKMSGESWACVNFPSCIPLKQVSVGKAGVWAVDSCGKLYVRNGITCDLPEGSHWLCISADHFMADSNSIPSFKQVSVGQTEVWTLNNAGIAQKRLGVSPDNPAGIGWSTGLSGGWQHITVRAV